jgi:predicted lysophospholipase L1 biosynthesis ABC-type transport system permease subunit
MVEQNLASSSYFQTLGIPLVEGHDLAEAEATSVPPHAVVSQSFARTFLPHGDPVGRHFDGGPAMSFDIVGVAKDLEEDRPTVYVQSGMSSLRTNVLVRVSGDPHTASEAIRTTVRAAYPEFLVSPRPLQEILNDGHLLERRMVLMLLLLAAVAVLLALAGVYGVVEFSVSQRLRELGIRAALGARPSQLVREVLFAGLKPVIVGLFAGVWLALVVENIVKATFTGGSMRFDTGNPAIYGAAASLLVAAAVAAMWKPARRGSRSDLFRALSYE